MNEIIVSKVEKNDISSCNICYARNYKTSTGFGLGEYDENLYKLLIGHFESCLCRNCLENVVTNITDFLRKEAQRND